MKKNIRVLLAILLIIGCALTGCSGNPSAQTTTLGTSAVTLPAAEPTELTIVTYETPKKEQDMQ
jgi:ABC-type Fe3+-siderophore transport system permease subunit